ncbi:MAG TPA: HEAT repeat domain-containing protein [Vicinamibacterales bacterium]|nr:HEAT repeat domain-containing protein [Vicinamibacterales bacterium]
MKKHCLIALVLSVVTTPVFAQQAQFQDVVRMLRHPDARERLKSVEMLREAGFMEAAEPVAPLIADPDDDVQLAAIETELSLFMLDDGSRRRLGGFMTSRPKSAGLAAFEAGPSVVKPVPVPVAVVDNLLLALDDANERVRFEAVHALGALAKPPLTVPQTRRLVAALDHYDPIVRAASARVIARLQVKEAEDALIAAIGDSNQAVRQFAMYALGEIESEKAIAALKHQIENYRSNTQATWALLALAKIGHESTADLFRQYLAAKDPGFRAASAEGLARVGADDFVPQLEQRLQGERGPAVQLAYFFALQKLGRNYLEHIVNALQRDETAPQAMEYLIELGPSMEKDLTPYLASREDNVRGRVAQVLGLVGTADVVPALETARLDRNDAVARAIAAAIDRIKTRQ